MRGLIYIKTPISAGCQNRPQLHRNHFGLPAERLFPLRLMSERAAVISILVKCCEPCDKACQAGAS